LKEAALGKVKGYNLTVAFFEIKGKGDKRFLVVLSH